MAQTNGMKLRIGVVGCGNISLAYMRNAPLFCGVEITACADLNADAAKRRAAEFNLRAADVDSLIDDRNIDLILNLTIPAAHFDVSMRALSTGKHVFTEKPLGVTAAEGRSLVDAAAAKGLMLGSAPDTFLGAAGRHARRQMEAGAIGKPVTGTAFMMGRGMEHWHPDPSFYYQAGAGPLMDMGPYYLTMMVNLMGPIRRVQAVATSGQEERLITAEGPKQGTTFKVGTPTSVQSLLEFDCGATVTFGTSWDVFRHSNHPIELHGTEGSLRLPDPDNFGGSVALSAAARPGRKRTRQANSSVPSIGRSQRLIVPTIACLVLPISHAQSSKAASPALRAIWRCTCSKSWKRSCVPAKPVSRRPFRVPSRSRGNCGKTKRGVCWHDTTG